MSLSRLLIVKEIVLFSASLIGISVSHILQLMSQVENLSGISLNVMHYARNLLLKWPNGS